MLVPTRMVTAVMVVTMITACHGVSRRARRSRQRRIRLGGAGPRSERCRDSASGSKSDTSLNLQRRATAPVAGDFCCNTGKPVSAAPWPARIEHLSLAALVPPEHILLVASSSLHKRSTHPTPRPCEFTQPSTSQEQYRSTQQKKKLQHSSSKIVLSEHCVNRITSAVTYCGIALTGMPVSRSPFAIGACPSCPLFQRIPP